MKSMSLVFLLLFLNSADAQSSYGLAPPSADDPMTIMHERTVTVTVPVHKETWEKTIERFGWRRRRCRIFFRKRVYREERSEERTIAEEFSLPALRGQPGAAESGQSITLKAPRSTGAIAELIARELDIVFPVDRFSFNRAINNSAVDYRTDQPVGALDLQIRVDIDRRDPRELDVLVVARDGLNEANSPTEAKQQLDAILPVLNQP